MKISIKELKRKEKGITLMALVITIIVILILAGISLSTLNGDNSLINKAGSAKTQNNIAEEKEIIEQATILAMGKSKNGDIDEISFKEELAKNNATVTKSGNKYKVLFTSGRQYSVDQEGNVKEKNPNALELSELNEKANTYFGWDVINYTETLDPSLNYMNWQLFYAGVLDGETEERIYLISKEYVKNTDLPTVVKNGVEVEGAKPIATSGSDYKAKFGNSISDGVMPQYSGSSNISTIMQKYNKSYFIDKKYTSTSANMKAVAYMLDTTTWNKFATSSKGYAEYSIGGPSIELLFQAYNKYKGTGYETEATSEKGYQVKKTDWDTFGNTIYGAIESDVTDGEKLIDSPFSVSSLSNQANGYWLSSPSGKAGEKVLFVTQRGEIFVSLNSYNYDYTRPEFGFRPIVLLNSNFTLEKTKDKDGNDAFKIVEQ